MARRVACLALLLAASGAVRMTPVAAESCPAPGLEPTRGSAGPGEVIEVEVQLGCGREGCWDPGISGQITLVQGDEVGPPVQVTAAGGAPTVRLTVPFHEGDNGLKSLGRPFKPGRATIVFAGGGHILAHPIKLTAGS